LTTPSPTEVIGNCSLLPVWQVPIGMLLANTPQLSEDWSILPVARKNCPPLVLIVIPAILADNPTGLANASARESDSSAPDSA